MVRLGGQDFDQVGFGHDAGFPSGLARDAGQIALASFVAFTAAAIVDAVIYQLLGKYPRWMRINGSNVPSAFVDSLIFPTLAFGSFLWPIVLGQFLAKVLGGFFWSLIFHWWENRKPKAVETTA